MVKKEVDYCAGFRGEVLVETLHSGEEKGSWTDEGSQGQSYMESNEGTQIIGQFVKENKTIIMIEYLLIL